MLGGKGSGGASCSVQSFMERGSLVIFSVIDWLCHAWVIFCISAGSFSGATGARCVSFGSGVGSAGLALGQMHISPITIALFGAFSENL